jgi:tRNA (guanine10-N2)-dimethyltransferase
MTICILGRQPRLGLAELEARFGADLVQPLGPHAALLEVEKPQQSQLGGTIKITRVITTLPQNTWRAAERFCLEELANDIAQAPEGKITLGLSAYGVRVTPRQLGRTALELKKMLRSHGRSVRVVPNTDTALNSAQVLHNNLTGKTGFELVFVASGKQLYIGQTISVQDVENYAQRDFYRPKRDAFVGMLPPKLAQIMISLSQPTTDATILDPFCGTGVVLMEAALQGYKIAGSDIDQRMVDYTQTNLQWLAKTYRLKPSVTELVRADATTHRWQKPLDRVVCETYLGKPLTALPDRQTLQHIINKSQVITRDFLQNLHAQLDPEARCTIAVPAWKSKNGFIHLPIVDDLNKIGYNRVSFSYADKNDLIYHRLDQIVARELLVLTRK